MNYNTQIIKDSMIHFNGNEVAFADTFYSNLFTDFPAAKELFEMTEMSFQKKALVSGIKTIVTNLDHSDELKHYLVDSGIRHITYGVLPPHYNMIKKNLQKTFKQTFGENWLPEIEANWNLLINYIISNMKIGALEVRPDLSEGFEELETT